MSVDSDTTDARGDVGDDAGSDAGSDAGRDAGLDASSDAGDASSDVGVDADNDAGPTGYCESLPDRTLCAGFNSPGEASMLLFGYEQRPNAGINGTGGACFTFEGGPLRRGHIALRAITEMRPVETDVFYARFYTRIENLEDFAAGYRFLLQRMLGPMAQDYTHLEDGGEPSHWVRRGTDGSSELSSGPIVAAGEWSCVQTRMAAGGTSSVEIWVDGVSAINGPGFPGPLGYTDITWGWGSQYAESAGSVDSCFDEIAVSTESMPPCL